MGVIEVVTGKKLPVRITPVVKEDHKKITKKRFHFLWESLLNNQDYTVYKVEIKGNKELVGVLAVQEFPLESRIEIKLLACSSENVGKDKVYEGIAGTLIAFACRLALVSYGRNACVSLVPKTLLRLHYINKYRMSDGGWQLYLEGEQLQNVLNEFQL